MIQHSAKIHGSLHYPSNDHPNKPRIIFASSECKRKRKIIAKGYLQALWTGTLGKKTNNADYNKSHSAWVDGPFGWKRRLEYEHHVRITGPSLRFLDPRLRLVGSYSGDVFNLLRFGGRQVLRLFT
ncbi:hypothetical protein CEXT_437631 [Caerostris extrusa]|uniref:Uncharacterized protein n=1 Tax=Caerostris extrusa TaxID=172846 RepID=A0AAV4NG06_CAEEX|nr:hypothetical protein CEXT_437631 [Caerostris extrusa]